MTDKLKVEVNKYLGLIEEIDYDWEIERFKFTFKNEHIIYVTDTTYMTKERAMRQAITWYKEYKNEE